MTPEANTDITGESASGSAQEARNTIAIVSSLWEKFESLIQLELKLALAEADDKVKALKRELFAEAEAKASTLKGEVFAEAEAKVSALKADVLAEADDRVSALKRELTAKAVAGSIALASMLALVAALIALLSLMMDVWLAALLTSSVLAVVSFVLLRRSHTPVLKSASARASLPPISSTKETSHGTI